MEAVPNAKPANALAYCPLGLVVAAVAGGILIDRCWPLTVVAWWPLAIVLIAVWLPVWLLRHDRWASGLLLLSAVAIGAAWHQAYWHLYPANEIGRMMREQSQPC